jgi:iron complex outermembrane recepter protein
MKSTRSQTAVRGCLFGSFVALLAVASSLSAQDEDPITLSPFEVNTARDVGYYASNSISATKTDIPLQDLPMNVQVLTRTFLDDVNATDIESVMEYSASVSPATNAPGRFNLRGFANPNPMRNGIDTLSEANWVSTLTLDRIEVVKGPAAILYGITEPGGLINMITKKPQFAQAGVLNFQVGDYDTYRAEIDVTGPLGGDAIKSAYRVVAGVGDEGYEQDFAHSKTVTVAPSLLLNINDASSLLLAVEYQELDANPRGAATNKLSATNERIGFIPGFFYDVPKTFNHQGFDAFQRTETTYLSADFQHQFADDRWAMRAVVTHSTTDLEQDARNGAGNERRSGGQLGFFRTNALARFVDREEMVFQGELTGRIETDTMTHRLLFGVEATSFEQDQLARRQNRIFPDTSFENPATWDFSIPIAPEDRAITPADFFFEQDTWSLYAMHQGEMIDSKLHTLLGFRYDTVDATNTNRRANPITATAVPTSENVTPQVGAVYSLTESLGIYASYSESFSPNTAVNPDGGTFDPATGEGLDFGLKFNAPDGRFNATLSVFDISKVGIVRQDVERRANDPDNGLWFADSGKERSRGFETDMILTPWENYQISLSYAYIDAYVVSNADSPGQEGNRLGETPEHNFAIWQKYTFTEGPAAGFFFGVGLNARSDSAVSPNPVDQTFEYPAYTALDLVLGYKSQGEKPWEVTVRLNNATDEFYFARSKFYANGRNLQVTARYRF